MRLTTFSDYTLRVLMYLALDPEKLANIPAIAAAYGISQNHLMKVVQQLSRDGLVESTRGKGGGIRLARPAAKIRLGELVRSSEGSAPFVECLGDNPGACCIVPVCRLKGILAGALNEFYEALDEYTLADLVAGRKGLAQVLKPGESMGLPMTRRR